MSIFSDQFLEQFSRVIGFFVAGTILILLFIIVLYFLDFFKNPLKIILQKSREIYDFLETIEKMDEENFSDKKLNLFAKLQHKIIKQKRLAEAFYFDNSEWVEVKKIIELYENMLEYIQNSMKDFRDFGVFKSKFIEKYDLILKLNESVLKQYFIQ